MYLFNVIFLLEYIFDFQYFPLQKMGKPIYERYIIIITYIIYLFYRLKKNIVSPNFNLFNYFFSIIIYILYIFKNDQLKKAFFSI